MRFPKALALVVPVAALALTSAHDASACGGCLHPTTISQSETSVVTGHRMVFAISKNQTTLWDQVSFAGAPSEFAWVLPIHGKVQVSLSSDALFESLDALTQVNISSPVITCDPPPSCGGGNASFAAGGDSPGDFGSGTGEGPPPVTVIAEEVVGPYETVQLKSSDAGALQGWLDSHGYAIPDDIAPIINAYLAEGFDFLAMKLVPGQGVQSMRPVRVTSPGASPVLPLRMVAAGTGAITPITLWIAGEGRYETTNAPTFTIGAEEILWNWQTSSSNYAGLKQLRFNESQGKAWLVEDAEQVGTYDLTQPLNWLAQYNPLQSGYGDPITGEGAEAEASADLQALLGDSALQPTVWLTRLHGELSRAALAEDLQIGASSNQNAVERFLTASVTVGTPPACPTYPPCAGGGSFAFFDGGGKIKGGGSASCAMTEGASAPAMLGGILIAAGLVAARRRRRR